MHSLHLYGWRFRLHCRMRQIFLSDMPHAWTPRIAAYGLQHSGNVLGCANWRRPTRWLCKGDRAFFPPLPYPSTDFIWRWGFISIQFMVKSTLSHYKGPCPIKHFHNAPCRLISKITALVKTTVRHDALAEKRVTKILKCFVISARLCSITFSKGASTHTGFLPESDPAPVVEFFTRAGMTDAGGQFGFERCTKVSYRLRCLKQSSGNDRFRHVCKVQCSYLETDKLVTGPAPGLSSSKSGTLICRISCVWKHQFIYIASGAGVGPGSGFAGVCVCVCASALTVWGWYGSVVNVRWIGIWVRTGTEMKLIHRIQIGSWSCPASCPVVTRSLRRVKLTTHLHIVLRIRMRGLTPPLPHTYS